MEHKNLTHIKQFSHSNKHRQWKKKSTFIKQFSNSKKHRQWNIKVPYILNTFPNSNKHRQWNKKKKSTDMKQFSNSKKQTVEHKNLIHIKQNSDSKEQEWDFPPLPKFFNFESNDV